MSSKLDSKFWSCFNCGEYVFGTQMVLERSFGHECQNSSALEQNIKNIINVLQTKVASMQSKPSLPPPLPEKLLHSLKNQPLLLNNKKVSHSLANDLKELEERMAMGVVLELKEVIK